MTTNRNFQRRAALCASISMFSLIFAAGAAMAQTADTRSVDLQGDRSLLPLSAPAAVGSRAPAGSAPALAPSQSSLSTGEPVSIVSDKVLRDVIPPTSDYNEAVKYTPGWVSNNTNGLLGDAKGGWRGFVDGQYNVTFDGIPFGDMNDPTHHSAAYFPAQFLGSVTADRGPGPASQVGYATFGGTLGLNSIDFSDEFGGYVQQTFGSFKTTGSVITVQSGKIPGSDARFLFQYNNSFTGGAIQDGKYNTNQFLAKAEDKLGDFTLTAMSTYGTENYNNIASITYPQWQANGKKYGAVNNNPLTQEFVGYNNSQKQTDMEYIDLNGSLAGWHVDNKLYTYAYTYPAYQNNGGDQTIEGLQSNSNNVLTYHGGVLNATYKNAAGVKQYLPVTGVASSDVIGYIKYNNYRAFGDIFEVDRHIDAGFASGQIRTGLWWEHGDNGRFQEWYDYTTGKNFQQLGNNLQTSFKLLLGSHMTTIQPFVEYEWSPLPKLTITPGFKWEMFDRQISAAVNQTTLQPMNYSHTYTSSQPYLAANYKLTDEVSVYAQASKGFLVPQVAAYYTFNPALNNVQPQSTDNYQAGVVFKNEKFTADADVYRIVASNYPVSSIVAGNTYYSDAGTAQYEGLEAEGSYSIMNGWSAYASAALIRAKFIGGANKGLRVGDAPDYTASFGMIYDDGKIFGSLMQKFVGNFYGSGGQSPTTFSSAGLLTNNGQLNHVPGYNTTDLVIGIRGKDIESVPMLRNVTFKVGMFNIFNHQSVTEIAGGGGASAAVANINNTTLTYSFLPGQTTFATLTIGF